MSSSEDEQPRGLAFTSETDFENGQWENGEFYYSHQRKGKKQSKAEALYGVFRGDVSDEDEQVDYQNKSRVTADRLHRPMAFVSGSTVSKDKQSDIQETTPDTEETRAGLGSGRTGLGSDRAGLGSDCAGLGSGSENGHRGLGAGTLDTSKDTNEEQSSMSNMDFAKLLKMAGATKYGPETPEERTDASATESARAEAAKSKPEVPLSQLGKFEKHTKGFGMKYLSKFGFKGRLGKFEQGVSKPIAVQVRPERRGLNYGNFKEAIHLRENREIAEEYFGDKLEPEIDETRKRKTQKDVSEGWKVETGAGKRRPKTVYKTAAEILAESAEAQPDQAAPQVIIDMRGPQTKVVGDMSELELGTQHDEYTQEAKKKKNVGEELRHNLTLLVHTTLVELHQNQRKLESSQHELTTLRRHQTVQQRRTEIRAQESGALHSIILSLEQLNLKIEQADCTLDQAASALEELHIQYSQEFHLYHLSRVIVATFHQVLSAELALRKWDPLDTQQTRKLAEQLRFWTEEAPAWASSDVQSRKLRNTIQKLIGELLFGYIRKAFQQWDPRDITPGITLVTELQPLISFAQQSDILHKLIFPRIKHTVESWDPRTDNVPLDSWTLPWRSVLESEMESLWPAVRVKFASALRDWDPYDDSAHSVLLPWGEVWSTSAMDMLLTRTVVPKLVSIMHHFEINPSDQAMDAWHAFMLWSDILPRLHFICILEGEFFPKWFAVLHEWISAHEEVDFGEVSTWYAGWKQQFPEEILEEPVIQEYFSLALDVMQYYAKKSAGADLSDDEEPQLLPPSSYAEALRLRRAATAAAQTPEQEISSVSKSPGVSTTTSKQPDHLTLREMVTHIAAEHGAEFVPNLNKGRVDGKQVYRFKGNREAVNLTLGDDILYIETLDKSKFVPGSMNDLLNRAGISTQ